MNSSGSRNKLYNFIVNTYGIGKEQVQQMVKDRLDDVFSVSLKEKIESMIRERVYKEIENKYRSEINDYVIGYVRKEVEREVKKLTKDLSFTSQIKVDFRPNIDIKLTPFSKLTKE